MFPQSPTTYHDNFIRQYTKYITYWSFKVSPQVQNMIIVVKVQIKYTVHIIWFLSDEGYVS